jgi:hypothetical protein
VHICFPRRRVTSVAAVATIAALGVATATMAPSAAGAPTSRAGTTSAASTLRSAVKPGRIGATITLAHNVSFDGDSRSYQMATDKSGDTYIAWISSNDNDSGGARAVHLCVIPKGARACAGTVKTLDPTGDSTASGLQLIVTPAGKVTIVWIANAEGVGAQIYYATATKTGPLSAQVTVATPLPVNSALYDAVPAPNGSIWLLAAPSDSALQVRKGLTGAPISVSLPHSWEFGAGTSSLVFSGSTPIIVAAKFGGGPLDPNAYSYEKGSSWTVFKDIPNSAAYSPVGLVHTTSGIRLITGDAKDFYYTAISKWKGHSFTTAAKLGGSLDLDSHDVSTDPSGRVVDVGLNDEKVTVLNLADTIHPAAFSFGLGSETSAGSSPAVTTSARGRGWVAWSYQGGNSTKGDTLVAAPIVLAGLHTSKTAHGAPGSVKVVGPASCLPPVSISVSVTGHPKKGWKVTKRVLTLGSKKVGSSLKGGSLTAGKTYSLKGTVTFGKGGSHKTVKAKLTFKSCPNS